MTVKRELVAEAIKKFPGKPKQTIAKWLREKYPLEFHSIENARTTIRRYTSSFGKHSSKNSIAGTGPAADSTPLKIPKGIKQNKPTVHINQDGTYLVTGDWHVPYHDERAMAAMFEFAIKQGVEHLYINGDAVDFYRVSQWEKDPKSRSMAEELDTLWHILDEVGPHFDLKYFKIGNHEDRFTRRMWQAVPELAVLPRFDVDQVLEVKDRGYKVVDSKQFAKFAGLWIVHGHELAKGAFSPVNVARGLFLRTRQTTASSHWHRTSSHIETGGMSKKITTCYSIGCLCGLSPHYAPTNNWNHGFAIVRVKGKEFFFDNYQIDRNGKVYSN